MTLMSVRADCSLHHLPRAGARVHWSSALALDFGNLLQNGLLAGNLILLVLLQHTALREALLKLRNLPQLFPQCAKTFVDAGD